MWDEGEENVNRTNRKGDNIITHISIALYTPASIVQPTLPMKHHTFRYSNRALQPFTSDQDCSREWPTSLTSSVHVGQCTRVLDVSGQQCIAAMSVILVHHNSFHFPHNLCDCLKRRLANVDCSETDKDNYTTLHVTQQLMDHHVICCLVTRYVKPSKWMPKTLDFWLCILMKSRLCKYLTQ